MLFSTTLLSACGEQSKDESEPQKKQVVVDSKQPIALQSPASDTGYGAFLSAQYAYGQQDLESAISYLEKTIGYQDTAEIPDYLQHKFFFANLYAGRTENLLEQYRKSDETEYPILLLHYTKAVQEKDWGKAQKSLDKINDKVPWKNLLEEWLIYAQEKRIDKTKDRKSWNQSFNLGLLELISGDDNAALQTFQFMNAENAKAPAKQRPKQRHWPLQLLLLELSLTPDNKRQALIERYQEQVRTGFATDLLNQLQKDLPAVLAQINVTRVEDGLGLLYFSIAAAMQSEGTQVVAMLHYRLAEQLLSDGLFKQLNQQVMGYSLEQQGFYDAAIQAYQGIAKDSPVYPFAVQRQSRVLWQQEKHQQAIALVKSTVNDRNRNILLPELADYYRLEEEYTAAIEIYDQLLLQAQTKGNWQLYFARGVAKHMDKSIAWDKAEKDLEKAYKLAPKEPEVLNYLGYSWVEQNKNLEQAEKMILEAVAARPRDGYIVDSVGWVYYKLGQYDKAVRYLSRAVQLKPSDPVINDHYGDALAKQGRILEAEFQWKRSLSLSPEPDLKKELQKKLGIVEVNE